LVYSEKKRNPVILYSLLLQFLTKASELKGIFDVPAEEDHTSQRIVSHQEFGIPIQVGPFDAGHEKAANMGIQF
jgi:hypothetical protein